MLDAAKSALQAQIMKALMDGFKATYIYGGGQEGDLIAMKFAQTAAGPIADAILTFVKQADITGSPGGLISPAGPVSGAVAPKTLMLI